MKRNNNTFFGQNSTNPAIVLLSKTTTESGLPLLFLCAPQPALYIRYIDRDWQKNFYIYQQLRSFFFFSLFIAQYKISG